MSVSFTMFGCCEDMCWMDDMGGIGDMGGSVMGVGVVGVGRGMNHLSLLSSSVFDDDEEEE